MCSDGDVYRRDECTCDKTSGQRSLDTVTKAGVLGITCMVHSTTTFELPLFPHLPSQLLVHALLLVHVRQISKGYYISEGKFEMFERGRNDNPTRTTYKLNRFCVLNERKKERLLHYNIIPAHNTPHTTLQSVIYIVKNRNH